MRGIGKVRQGNRRSSLRTPNSFTRHLDTVRKAQLLASIPSRTHILSDFSVSDRVGQSKQRNVPSRPAILSNTQHCYDCLVRLSKLGTQSSSPTRPSFLPFVHLARGVCWPRGKLPLEILGLSRSPSASLGFRLCLLFKLTCKIYKCASRKASG